MQAVSRVTVMDMETHSWESVTTPLESVTAWTTPTAGIVTRVRKVTMATHGKHGLVLKDKLNMTSCSMDLVYK